MFRSKRTSAAAYRRRLWNSTLDATHYRSAYNVSFSLTSQATSQTSTTSLINALHGDANFLWYAAGGAVDPTGGAVPTGWGPSFIIRGGMITWNAANFNAGTQSMKVTLYLIKSGANFDTTSFPASVFDNWDPSLIANFKDNYGKILMKKVMMIENDGVAEVSYRLPVHKIMQADFVLNRHTYIWIALLNGPEAAANSVRCTIGHNLSFVGDIIV